MSKAKVKTQEQFFWEAHRKMRDADKIFMFDILPDLTLAEFEILAKKRPPMYEKYRRLVEITIRDREYDEAFDDCDDPYRR